MTWIFCSGVTIKSWSPRRVNSVNAYWVDDLRPPPERFVDNDEAERFGPSCPPIELELVCQRCGQDRVG